MKIGVLGGGFGLYGWMPALCQYFPNDKVFVSMKHKEKFTEREELKIYENQIEWKSINEIINQCEFLIIAIPPYNVFNYIHDIINSSTIKKIIIEKPICENYKKSEKFINEIEKKGIKLCSSYLFMYTDWFQKLKNELKNSNIEINWKIKKRDSVWKNDPSIGGGALNFYGIHLLSLIGFFDYDLYEITNCSSDSFEAVFKKMDKLFSIKINICEKNSFIINDFVNQETPFGTLNVNNDFRIIPIKMLLNDFEKNYDQLNSIMKKTNKLWGMMEY